MRIVDGVYLVGGSSYNLSSGCNVYLIDTLGAGFILIDIGSEEDVEMVKANIIEEGFDPDSVSALFLTHSHLDHSGGAALAKKTFKCKLVAHELTAEAIESGFQRSQGRLTPAYVDIKLRGGETLTFGKSKIEVFDASGHTREGGDLCYGLKVEGKSLLFTGDTAFKCDRGLMAGHPVSSWLGSRDIESIRKYLRSLENLSRAVKPDILLPGHGLLALKGGWRELQECIRIVSEYAEKISTNLNNI